MRPALILKLAARRNSIPPNLAIECNTPFLGCLPQITDGYSGARKKGVPFLHQQSPPPKPPFQEGARPMSGA